MAYLVFSRGSFSVVVYLLLTSTYYTNYFDRLGGCGGARDLRLALWHVVPSGCWLIAADLEVAGPIVKISTTKSN